MFDAFVDPETGENILSNVQLLKKTNTIFTQEQFRLTALWALVAWRKIGCQTGDILGSSQQLSEVAGLLTLVSLWA